MTENKPMKVKELVEVLQNCNQEADVIICYEHHTKGEKPQCYYKPIEDISYQHIVNNKLEVNKNLLMIWGK